MYRRHTGTGDWAIPERHGHCAEEQEQLNQATEQERGAAELRRLGKLRPGQSPPGSRLEVIAIIDQGLTRTIFSTVPVEDLDVDDKSGQLINRRTGGVIPMRQAREIIQKLSGRGRRKPE